MCPSHAASCLPISLPTGCANWRSAPKTAPPWECWYHAATGYLLPAVCCSASHTHTHTLRTAKQEKSKKSGWRKLLRSCRVALDVLRSVTKRVAFRRDLQADCSTSLPQINPWGCPCPTTATAFEGNWGMCWVPPPNIQAVLGDPLLAQPAQEVNIRTPAGRVHTHVRAHTHTHTQTHFFSQPFIHTHTHKPINGCTNAHMSMGVLVEVIEKGRNCRKMPCG